MSTMAVMKDVFQMSSRKLKTVWGSKQTELSLLQANYSIQAILEGN